MGQQEIGRAPGRALAAQWGQSHESKPRVRASGSGDQGRRLRPRPDGDCNPGDLQAPLTSNSSRAHLSVCPLRAVLELSLPPCPSLAPAPGECPTHPAYSPCHSTSAGWGLIPSEPPRALPFLAQKPCRPSTAPTPLCADHPSPWDPDPSWSHEKRWWLSSRWVQARAGRPQYPRRRAVINPHTPCVCLCEHVPTPAVLSDSGLTLHCSWTRG